MPHNDNCGHVLHPSGSFFLLLQKCFLAFALFCWMLCSLGVRSALPSFCSLALWMHSPEIQMKGKSPLGHRVQCLLALALFCQRLCSLGMRSAPPSFHSLALKMHFSELKTTGKFPFGHRVQCGLGSALLHQRSCFWGMRSAPPFFFVPWHCGCTLQNSKQWKISMGRQSNTAQSFVAQLEEMSWQQICVCTLFGVNC